MGLKFKWLFHGHITDKHLACLENVNMGGVSSWSNASICLWQASTFSILLVWAEGANPTRSLLPKPFCSTNRQLRLLGSFSKSAPLVACLPFDPLKQHRLCIQFLLLHNSKNNEWIYLFLPFLFWSQHSELSLDLTLVRWLLPISSHIVHFLLDGTQSEHFP